MIIRVWYAGKVKSLITSPSKNLTVPKTLKNIFQVCASTLRGRDAKLLINHILIVEHLGVMKVLPPFHEHNYISHIINYLF